MNWLDFLLSWTPVALITFLAVGFRRPALELALWATVWTVALVFFRFGTPPDVILLSGADGVLRNLPVLLVIYSGMLLSGFMLEIGSLDRFVRWFTEIIGDRRRAVIALSVGSGNFMEGAGVVAEPIIAPMLVSTGLPAPGAAALSIAGYSGLMILELGGSILTVLALVTGLDPVRLGVDTAVISLPAVLLLIILIPWLTFEGGGIRSSLPINVYAGLLAGCGALFAAIFIGYSVAGLFGGLAVLGGIAMLGKRPARPDRRTTLDMAPLLFLVACLFSINLAQPLRGAVEAAWSFEVSAAPGHPVRFQPLASAYTYIALSYIIALILRKDPNLAWKSFISTNLRAWRPMLAMALFGVAGQVIAFSGYGSGFSTFDPGRNIAMILANGMIAISGRLYPLFVPFIGWVGTFLTGYGTASIVLFGKLHVATAQMLGMSPSMTASAMAVGSAVGSISSPLKVALATSMCGAVGRDGEILRRTIPLGVAISLVLGAVLLMLGWFGV